MEINAVGKLKYYDNGYVEGLRLIVKFKLPGKLIHIKKKKFLTHSNWINSDDGYDDHQHFQDVTLRMINNKGYLKDVIEKVVLNYIKNDSKGLNAKDKRKQIDKLLKGNQNIKVNVKVN